jgi:hypothetical protein
MEFTTPGLFDEARWLCFANVRPLLPCGCELELSWVVTDEKPGQYELTVWTPEAAAAEQVRSILLPIMAIAINIVPIAVVHVRGAIVLSASVSLMQQLFPDVVAPIDGMRDRAVAAIGGVEG